MAKVVLGQAIKVSTLTSMQVQAVCSLVYSSHKQRKKRMLNLREKCEAQGLVVDEAVLAKLNDYMTLFAAWAKVHNLTAIKKPQAQVDLLLMPSLSISKHKAKYDKVLDLGSGGGFPGLALAILQNKKKWVLVEKSPKKCAFLRHVIHQLKLDNTSLIVKTSAISP